MNRFILPLGAFLLLLVVLVVGLVHAPEKGIIVSPLLGKPAPPFSLPGLLDQASPLQAQSLRGHWTLVNVWGTWCVECRAEHETLLAIKAQGRVPIYGIDWKDDDAQARAWLNELGNPYERIGADREGRVAIDWGVYGAPESFLVNPAGTVVYKYVGALTPEVWQREFLAPAMKLIFKTAAALIAGAVLLGAAAALAIDNSPPLPDPKLQQRYLDLTHELRCMQCQNESLADSPVGLASDLRRDVREQILAGATDEQIRDHMVARYGEFILFRPRLNARTAWLWFTPGVLMIVGLLIGVRVLRDRQRRVDVMGPPDEDAARAESNEP